MRAVREALLLDYGGVMTTSILESFASFCDTEGIDVDVFRAAVLGAARSPESPFARVETGAISQEEFDVAVAELLTHACGREITSDGLKQRMFATVKPVKQMSDAVRAARDAGVRTALVSNSWGGRDYPLGEFPLLFDVTVISGDIGMRKPEPEIYRYAADALGVATEACVFVDDLRVNIEGAEAVGMVGILHTDADTTIAQLEGIFGMSLRAGAR
jgi:putative hydrolase of the HAD superfamily